MLKKFFISLSIILSLSFTSCGGGSSKEARELLSKILQFVGIPHDIIVNVCQDKNGDGVCGAKEIFTKLIIKKGESVSDILRKLSLTPDGRYFLKNVDPTLPILVEFQDEAKVNQADGKFTLEFNAFENEEQNETKEISILEAMVDADGLTKAEADKFRTLKNKEAQDKYYATLLNDLETNINTLRANGLDNQKAVIASIKEMADETKANQEQADRINGCENNQTCVDKEIKKISDELIIDEDEAVEIRLEQIGETSTTDISKGLVAHYKFEGNVNDSSGNGNDGIEHGGVSYVDGVIGKALKTETGGITIEKPFKKTFFTISLWSKAVINHNQIYGNTWIAVWHDATDKTKQSFGFTPSSGNHQVYLQHEYPELIVTDANNNTGAGTSLYYGDNQLPEASWKHIILTYENRKINIYVDGVLIIKDKITKVSSVNRNLEITVRENDKIDDLRIYNRALNKAEIQALYNLRQ